MQCGTHGVVQRATDEWSITPNRRTVATTAHSAACPEICTRLGATSNAWESGAQTGIRDGQGSLERKSKLAPPRGYAGPRAHSTCANPNKRKRREAAGRAKGKVNGKREDGRNGNTRGTRQKGCSTYQRLGQEIDRQRVRVGEERLEGPLAPEGERAVKGKRALASGFKQQFTGQAGR